MCVCVYVFIICILLWLGAVRVNPNHPCGPLLRSIHTARCDHNLSHLLERKRVKGALQLLMNRYRYIRFAQVPELRLRVSSVRL